MPGPMYDDELAALFKGENKPYRPSNGTEGTVFDDNWCAQCKHDQKYRQTMDGKDGCNILAAALLYDIDDEEYPEAWRHDDQGQPCCTAFESK